MKQDFVSTMIALLPVFAGAVALLSREARAWVRTLRQGAKR